MDAVYLKQMYELEDSYWWFVAQRRLVRSLIGRYAGSSPLKILDAGAGTGALVSSLAEHLPVWLYFSVVDDLKEGTDAVDA